MTHVPAPTQSFCRTFDGQPRIWATTPLLWLMSLYYQHNGYSTAASASFQFADVSTLLPHATERQARMPISTSWARADLAVPVVLVQVVDSGQQKPRTLLVDGINRVRKLHSLGIPQVEVMVVVPQVATMFEVPVEDAVTAEAFLKNGQTHPALQAIYDEATANLLQNVFALRDAARKKSMVLPDLPLPQTLHYMYALP